MSNGDGNKRMGGSGAYRESWSVSVCFDRLQLCRPASRGRREDVVEVPDPDGTVVRSARHARRFETDVVDLTAMSGERLDALVAARNTSNNRTPGLAVRHRLDEGPDTALGGSRHV